MSDDALRNATSPHEVDQWMAGFEAGQNADAHGIVRAHLRARLVRRLSRHVLSDAERAAVYAVRDRDDVAAHVVGYLDQHRLSLAEAGSLLDFLRQIDWAELLKLILAIVPLFLEQKPAVSPYGVPEPETKLRFPMYDGTLPGEGDPKHE